ncbi:hypothetical protein GCM10009740_12020 [Terrabacter terrae]|uniref:Uncharacterized protein n=1 Tax=Terrabacter terrae TaxID=318434 RepID=A0ABN2TXH7_9MICO
MSARRGQQRGELLRHGSREVPPPGTTSGSLTTVIPSVPAYDSTSKVTPEFPGVTATGTTRLTLHPGTGQACPVVDEEDGRDVHGGGPPVRHQRREVARRDAVDEGRFAEGLAWSPRVQDSTVGRR